MLTAKGNYGLKATHLAALGRGETTGDDQDKHRVAYLTRAESTERSGYPLLSYQAGEFHRCRTTLQHVHPEALRSRSAATSLVACRPIAFRAAAPWHP